MIIRDPDTREALLRERKQVAVAYQYLVGTTETLRANGIGFAAESLGRSAEAAKRALRQLTLLLDVHADLDRDVVEDALNGYVRERPALEEGAPDECA